MSRRKKRILNREEVSITGEVDYIIKKAQRGDIRVVHLWPLVFFSTHTCDAWVLHPSENLALCLAQNGERRDFTILETPTNFQIGWEAHYRIDDEMFTVSLKDGRVRTIWGYPTREIENTLGR